MKPFSNFTKGILFMSALASSSTLAATFVYVSNAEDGEIGAYSMQADGALQAPRAHAGGESGDADGGEPEPAPALRASRSKPYTVHVYSIDPGTGALKPLSTRAPRGELPVHLSRPQRALLFGASYAGHLVSVNAVGGDGRVLTEPLQVIPVGRNAHSILVDASNRYVYAPNLGTDQIFQFVFDEKSGRLRRTRPRSRK